MRYAPALPAIRLCSASCYPSAQRTEATGGAVNRPTGREPDKVGRPRHLDDDTERRKIMDAAVQGIARNGYGQMSVGDVLAEAQLSTTSFYRHFHSKDALLAAVIRRDGESAQRA